jgi:hypothetical protein
MAQAHRGLMVTISRMSLEKKGIIMTAKKIATALGAVFIVVGLIGSPPHLL